MATKRRRWRGDKTFRRVMKGMPDAVRKEMADVLVDGGRDIRRMMAARAPRRTGALQQGILCRVLPKTLKLRVGLIGTKRGRAKLFYGRILDLGRKAQVVSVRRRKVAGSVLSRGRKVAGATYQMRVRAIAPMRFITGRYGDARSIIQKRLRGIFDRALKNLAGGGND